MNAEMNADQLDWIASIMNVMTKANMESPDGCWIDGPVKVLQEDVLLGELYLLDKQSPQAWMFRPAEMEM